jgi:hypothetical protein
MALKWTLIVSVVVGATFTLYICLLKHFTPQAVVTVNTGNIPWPPLPPPTAYEIKVDKIYGLYESASTSRPSAADEAELFDEVLHDPDFRIQVRAMAVLPFVRDREKAIDVLIKSVHYRDPNYSENANVPLAATLCLAKMKATRAVPDVADWVAYMQEYRPYGEKMGPTILQTAMKALSRLKSASTLPSR